MIYDSMIFIPPSFRAIYERRSHSLDVWSLIDSGSHIWIFGNGFALSSTCFG
jgi:hypothetical protein